MASEVAANGEIELEALQQNEADASGVLDETMNPNSSDELKLISSNRLYFTGKDKTKGTRIWVQADETSNKYWLYAFEENKDGDEYYSCIQCSRYSHRHNKAAPSFVKICTLPDGTRQLWEKVSHYQSCYLEKSVIENIQNKYHDRPNARTSSSFPKKASVGNPEKKLATVQKTPRKKAGRPSRRGKARSKSKRSRVSAPAPLNMPTEPSEAPARKIAPRSRTTVTFAPTTARQEIYLEPNNGQQEAPESIVEQVSIPRQTFYRQRSVGPQASVAESFSHLITESNMIQPPKSKPYVSTHQINLQPSVPTPPLLSNGFVNEGERFKPKILFDHESLYHSIPSTHEFREMLAMIGLEYHPSHQGFWQKTLLINEISGATKAAKIQPLAASRNLGFQAISLFLTSSENDAFKIQEFIKTYIYKTYFNPAAQACESYNELMRSALCNFTLENMHLWVLTKIMNVRIVVFVKDQIHVYGETFNNSIPSILLKKEGEKFWPVYGVQP